MSNLNSYNILINRFKAFADGHFLLKNFTYGAITLADLQKFGLYPFMHIVPVDVSYETGVKNFSFDVFFADLPREEENKGEYQKETLSDLQQIAEDLLGEITNHRVLFGKDVSVLSSRLVPFEEEFSNVLTGWNLSITLQIPYNWSACDTPATFNDYIVYNQSTGESTILEFKDSIVREGGEVRLVNDLEFPPASYYYGTDATGNRGWFIFPTDEIGLTCETLASCSTITDIQTNITNLENDVEDLSANVVDIQMDITTIEGNITTIQTDISDLQTEVDLKANTSDISAVGFSNDYNDLDNLPNIPDSTSDLINDSGFITINDVPTSVSVVSHEVKLGSAMTKGTPVYVSGADGTNMIVSPASNGSEATSSKTLGLLMEGGNNNAKVFVITEGLLDGLNTSTATIGDAVWLGSTGTLIYGLANKPVAPLHLVFIGIVTRVNTNNGEIFVKVQNGFELQEIHNVLIESVSDNQVLQYESATSLWKNKTLATGLAVGTTPITSGAVGRVLFEGTGNVLQESANLFWNNTSTTLSIGTSSPTMTSGFVGMSVKAPTNFGCELRLDTTDSDRLTSLTFATANVNKWRIYLDTANGSLKFQDLAIPVTTPLTIFNEGNIAIGTTTDAGYKLDVVGTTRISGNLSATGNYIQYGTNANVGIGATNNGSAFVSGGPSLLYATANVNNLSIYGHNYYSGNYNATTGTQGVVSFVGSVFSATSGNAVFNIMNLTAQINQTGTANGITRGLYIAPTLTSATDFRAIETTSGKVVFNGGNVGIGTSTPAVRLDVVGDAIITGASALSNQKALLVRNTSGLHGLSVSNNAEVSIGRNQLFVFSDTSSGGYLFNISASNSGISFSNNAGASRPVSFIMNTGEILRIHQSYTSIVTNNFLIGTTTDAGYKLDVNGSTRVKGGGSTGSTNALVVQNSSGTQLLRIRDDGYTIIGSSTQGIDSVNAIFSQYFISTGSAGNVFGTYTSFIPSAIVQCDSTTRGFLPPRMTTTQKNAIASPVAGLVVYDSTTNKLCCYNGTTWNDLF